MTAQDLPEPFTAFTGRFPGLEKAWEIAGKGGRGAFDRTGRPLKPAVSACGKRERADAPRALEIGIPGKQVEKVVVPAPGPRLPA